MFTYLLNAGDQDVVNHISRLTSTNPTVITAVTTLILGLKTDFLWNKIDVLCVAHDIEADSLLNLKGNSTGAPDSITAGAGNTVFTANRGFLTVDADSWISLTEPESGFSLYVPYDAHVFYYVRTFNSIGGTDRSLTFSITGGGSSNISVTESVTPDRISFSMQGILMHINQDAPIGFAGMSVTTLTNRFARLNDTTIDDATVKFYTLDTLTDAAVGGLLPSGGNVSDQFAAWGVGGGLTAAELGLYENRIRTYMQAIGADVY